MNCSEFNPQKYATRLILEGSGLPSGIKTLEHYLHEYTCSMDDRAMAEFIARNKSLTLDDLGLIYEGLDSLDSKLNQLFGNPQT